MRASVLAGLLGLAALGVAWAAGPTALLVKFKSGTNAVKPVAVVDGDGNLLFTTTTPGKVEITNPIVVPPASSSGPRPSDMRSVRATDGCPGVGGAFASAVRFAATVNPDGTTGVFSIPAGKVFVVTSLGVVGGTGVPGATPGDPVQIQLGVRGSGGSLDAIPIQNVIAGSAGSFGLHVNFPTGIVATANATLCIAAMNANTTAPIGAGGSINGYFADDM